MIDSKIINHINLNENNALLEVYKSKSKLFLFNVLKTLYQNSGNSSGTIFVSILAKFLFFLQIFINSTIVSNKASLDTEYESELTYRISNYINFIPSILAEAIGSPSKYLKLIQFMGYYTLLYILLISLLIIATISKKRNHIYLNSFYNFSLKILNLTNIVTIDYIFYPIIYIGLSTFQCENGVHIYLSTTCYTGEHLAITIMSILILLLQFLILLLFTFFDVDLGGVCERRFNTKINTKYEFYLMITKFIFATFSFLIIKLTQVSKIYVTLYIIFILLFAMFQAIFIWKFVLFFSKRMQNFINIFWWITLWSAIVNLCAVLVKLNFLIFFHLLGWVLIILLYSAYNDYNIKKTLYNFGIFHSSSIKEIIQFKNLLVGYIEDEHNKENDIIVLSLANSFKAVIETNEDLKTVFNKFKSDSHLQNNLKNKTDYEIICLIYVLLNHFMKSETSSNASKSSIFLNEDLDREELTLHMCLFLINNLRNYAFSIYLLSKIKFSKIRNEFLKYVLLENIKNRDIQNLSKIYKNETIKSIEIGSTILHNLYTEELIRKIQTEIKLQINYFSFLNKEKNKSENSLKNFEEFLECGDKIMNLKKDIQTLYPKLLGIHPSTPDSNRSFSEYDFYYKLYLDEVEQDDLLITKENKNYIDQLNKYYNKGNLYKSLFNDNSCLTIVDGFIDVGTIIYYSENLLKVFPLELNKLKQKININDFVPLSIEHFHTEVVMNGIRFSNLSNVFGKHRVIFLRGNGLLTNMAKVYIRPVPNFEHGLMYIISLLKVNESNSSCTIFVDSEFRLDCMTNPSIIAKEQNNSYDGRDVKAVQKFVKPDNNLQNEFRNVKENLDKISFGTVNVENLFKEMSLMNVMMLVPQILIYTKYSKEKGFYFDHNCGECFGILYHFDGTIPMDKNEGRIDTSHSKQHKLKNSQKIESIEFLINQILENIRVYGHYFETNNEKENASDIANQFKNLTDTLEEYSDSSSLINFSLITRIFVNGLYKYHRVVINRTMLSHNEEGKSKKEDKQILYAHSNSIVDKDSNKFLLNFNTGIKINEQNKSIVREQNSKKNLKENEKVSDRFEFNINNNSQGSSSTLNNISNLDLLHYLIMSIAKLKTILSTKSVVWMKTLFIIFFFSTISLLLLSISYSNSSFSRMNTFLTDDKFFNKTIIYFDSIYATLRNFKEIKYGVYSDAFCDSIAGDDCLDYNRNFLNDIINEYQIEKSQVINFPIQFTSILFEEVNLNIGINDVLKISKGSLIDLILGRSLNINSNLEEYFSNFNMNNFQNSIFNDVQSYLLNFTYANTSFPFSGIEIIPADFPYSSFFATNNDIIIVNFILLIFLISIICFFNVVLYRTEKDIATGLLDFNHNNNSVTLFLENLVKLDGTFRGNNESEMKETLIMNENGEFTKSDKKENSIDHINIKNHRKEVNINTKLTKKEKDKKKINKENIRKKQENERRQRVSKIQTLTNFFFINFLKLLLIISVVLITSLCFYIILMSMNKSSIINSLNFFQTIEEIDTVYQTNFQNYLNVKKALSDIIDEEINYFDLDSIYSNELNNYPSSGNFSHQFYIDFLQNCTQNNSITANYSNYVSGLFTDKFSDPIFMPQTMPSFDRLIDTLISFNVDPKNTTNGVDNIYTLYKEDMCMALFNTTETKNLQTICYNFQNNKLGGIEQTLSNLNLMYSNIVNSFRNYNQSYGSDINLADVLTGDFGIYQNYVIYYFFKAYSYTHAVSQVITSDLILAGEEQNYYLFIAFFIVCLIFLMFILGSVNKIDKNLKSFLNFLSIIPSKYVAEDVGFARSIIRLKDRL